MIRVIFVTVLGIYVSIGALGQPVLTLTEAIQAGLQNNYNIRIVKNDAAIASNNVTPGNAGFLPSLAATGGITQSINNSDQQYISGQEVEKNGAKNTSAEASVFLDWTLFDGLGMFVTNDQLKSIEQTGLLQVRQQVENTLSLVIAAYYQVVRSVYLLSALEQQQQISAFRKDILDTRLGVGSASKIEVLKSTVDYNADQNAVIRQEAEVQKSKVILNQLLARDVSMDFTVDTTVQWNSDLNYETLRQDLLKKNADLLINDEYVKFAELNVKQTNALRYPVISFNSGYDFIKSTSESGFLSSNKTSGFYYGLTASINIFDGFNINRQHQNDKISVMTQQLSKEQTQLSIESELKRMYLDYVNNLKLIDLERENVAYAEENAAIAQESYQVGGLSDLELREIQKNLVDAKVRLVEAGFAAKLQETDLLRITGNLLK
jgi:outer membrane protein TolC